MAKLSLGRGLGAILGEVEEAYLREAGSSKESIKEIDIDSILPNPFQPRKNFSAESLQELAESIKSHGLLQPVLVVQSENGFTLIAGERRLRASMLLGVEKIRAIVADIETGRMRELALIENIQRENLNVIELAQSLKELIEEHGVTHEDISEVVKKSRSFITNTLRLLSLSEYTKEKVISDAISAGHARAMVGLGEDEQKSITDSIIGQNLSVRDTEKLIGKIKQEKLSKLSIIKHLASSGKLDFHEAVETFKKRFDIKAAGSKKKLTIVFESQKELDNFCKKLAKKGHE